MIVLAFIFFADGKALKLGPETAPMTEPAAEKYLNSHYNSPGKKKVK